MGIIIITAMLEHHQIILPLQDLVLDIAGEVLLEEAVCLEAQEEMVPIQPT